MKQTLQPEDFALVRVATLPIQNFVSLPRGINEVRKFLAKLVEDEIFAGALLLASREFYARVKDFYAYNDSSRDPKKEKKILVSLLKYLTRMSTRATPFGLFAGISLASISSKTSLHVDLVSQSECSIDIDSGLIADLTDILRKDERLGRYFKYVVNNSLHGAGGGWISYIETATLKEREKFRQSRILSHESVVFFVDLFSTPTTKIEAAERFIERYKEVNAEEVYSYIEDLVKENIIYPETILTATGEVLSVQFQEWIKSALKEHPGNEKLKMLLLCVAKLASSSRIRPSQVSSVQEKFASEVKEVFPDIRVNYPVKADLVRSFSESSLSSDSIRILSDLLIGMLPREDESLPAIKTFSATFSKVYGSRSVPLLQALDQDVGLVFGPGPEDEKGVIYGLPFRRARRSDEPGGAITPFQELLLAKLFDAKELGDSCIILSEDDRRELRELGDVSMLPSSFNVMLSGYRNQTDGEDLWQYKGCFGPSAINLFGRFCHAHEQVLGRSLDHLARSEPNSGDVVFAEIVYMPRGRAGNVVSRPHLRSYEIPVLGRSRLPDEKQIQLTDLYVSCENGKIRLWSKKLLKQVVPTLTCAHNYTRGVPPVYLFLCCLARQFVTFPKAEWPRQLSGLRSLPRVMSGNVIILSKRWRVCSEDVRSLLDNDGAHLPARWKLMEEKYGIDRYVELRQGDGFVTIDLWNHVSIQILVSEIRGENYVYLSESIQTQFDSLVCGLDNKSYSNEIIIPYTNKYWRDRSTSVNVDALVRCSEFNSANKRIFFPGSDWTSIKLYGNRACLEKVLVEFLFKRMRAMQNSGACQKWFFLRYSDPEPHIRIRLYGNYDSAASLVRPLNEDLERYIVAGYIKSIEISPYVREVERYGGFRSIGLAESLFHEESVMLSDNIQIEPAFGDSFRWKIALAGCLSIAEFFVGDDHKRLAMLEGMRASFSEDFDDDRVLRSAIGKKYRMLDVSGFVRAWSSVSDADSFFPGFNRYKLTLDTVAKSYVDLQRSGGLVRPLETISVSFMHMLNNRVFSQGTVRSEFVVYDFLRRVIMERIRR